MSALFPEAPFIPTAREIVQVCEWMIPAPLLQRRDYFRTYKALPVGMPDYLSVSIEHDEEGTGRCTAAIYGGRAYVIHYEFIPH